MSFLISRLWCHKMKCLRPIVIRLRSCIELFWIGIINKYNVVNSDDCEEWDDCDHCDSDSFGPDLQKSVVRHQIWVIVDTNTENVYECQRFVSYNIIKYNNKCFNALLRTITHEFIQSILILMFMSLIVRQKTSRNTLRYIIHLKNRKRPTIGVIFGSFLTIDFVMEC